MKTSTAILIAAVVVLLYTAAAYRKERIALSNDLDRSEFVHIRDTHGFNWTVKRADIFRIEPGFFDATNILVRLHEPERAIIVTPQTRDMVDMLLK